MARRIMTTRLGCLGVLALTSSLGCVAQAPHDDAESSAGAMQVAEGDEATEKKNNALRSPAPSSSTPRMRIAESLIGMHRRCARQAQAASRC
jgi:hypothetical protein